MSIRRNVRNHRMEFTLICMEKKVGGLLKKGIILLFCRKGEIWLLRTVDLCRLVAKIVPISTE